MFFHFLRQYSLHTYISKKTFIESILLNILQLLKQNLIQTIKRGGGPSKVRRIGEIFQNL